MYRPENGAFPFLWHTPEKTVAPSVEVDVMREDPHSGKLAPNPIFMIPATETYGRFDPVEYLFNNPTYNNSTLEDRQRLVAELEAMRREPNVSESVAGVFGFGELHNWLVQPVFDPKLSIRQNAVYTPRIEQYRRDGAKLISTESPDGSEYEKDQHRVWELPNVLARSQEAAAGFMATYAVNFPLLTQAVTTQLDILEQQMGINVSEYIRAEGRKLPDGQQIALDDSRSLYRDVTNASRLAESVATLPLSPVSTGDGRDISFRDATQSRFVHKGQDPQSMTLGEKPVILTGRNGGGKTFALEAFQQAISSGRTIGSASVGSAHIPPVQHMISLERPNSGVNGLSAAGQDFRQWGDTLMAVETARTKTPEGLVVVFGDEPLSGTDAEGQQVILSRLLGRLAELGARVIITTHTDLSGIVDSGIVDAYNVHIDGKKHVIERGIGTSDAFAEARRQGFDEVIILRAEALAAGGELDLTEVVEQQNTTMTPAEYYGANGKPVGLTWFYNHKPAEPERRRRDTGLYISDKEYFDTWSLRAPELIPKYGANVTFGKDGIFGYVDDASYYVSSILRGLMENSGTASLDVLEKRQDFFDRAAYYEQLAALRLELDDFRELVFSLSSERYVYKDDRVPRELALPLLNLPETFSTIADDIGAHTGDLLKSTAERIRNAHLHDMYNQQIVQTLCAIVDAAGTDRARKFAHAYRDLFLKIQALYTPLRDENEFNQDDDYSKRHGIKIPVDPTLRDEFYALRNLVHEHTLSKLSKKERKDKAYSNRYDHMMQALDQIFYSFSLDDFFDNNRDRFKPKKQIGYNGLRELYSFLSSSHKGPLSCLCEFIKDETTFDVKALPQFADDIESLYRAGLEAEYNSLVTSSPKALSVLRFVAWDHRPVDSIAAHFDAIGGAIGADLARYFDTAIRSFFDGNSQGKSYGEFVKDNKKRITHDPSVANLRFDKLFGSYYSRQRPVTPYSETEHLVGLLEVASTITNNGYAKWVRSDSVHIEQARNVDHPEHKHSDVTYPQGGIDVISGSNMSGKTTLLRALYANHALAQSIGLVPSASMSSPLYEHVIFADRPKHETGKGLSSFDKDIEYWKGITEKLRDAAPSIVFVDEPFSTTSSHYQENLMLASLEWLARRGHRVVVATHNHEAVRRLQKSASDPNTRVDVTFRHFGTEMVEGEIRFTHDLLDGSAGSEAVAVARLLGGEALARLLA